MVLCAAYNCNVRSGDNVPMYLFPKDPDICKLWVDKLRTDKYWPSKHSKLCIRHFKPDQFIMDLELAKEVGFKRVALKENAVPCIFDYSTPSKRRNSQCSDEIREKHPRLSKAQIKSHAIENLETEKFQVEANQTAVVDNQVTSTAVHSLSEAPEEITCHPPPPPPPKSSMTPKAQQNVSV